VGARRAARPLEPGQYLLGPSATVRVEVALATSCAQGHLVKSGTVEYFRGSSVGRWATIDGRAFRQHLKSYFLTCHNFKNACHIKQLCDLRGVARSRDLLNLEPHSFLMAALPCQGAAGAMTAKCYMQRVGRKLGQIEM
jgi:hypothetical protein